MARLPESRRKTADLVAGAKAFVDHSIAGLKTQTEIVFPSVAARGGRRVLSVPAAPHTAPRSIPEWSSRSGDCLHCGEALSAAVPIAKFKTDGAYWVFGQFCGAPCALGYCREHALGPQVALWTREMLRIVFQVKGEMTTAPPRFMLARYGGTLDPATFRATAFCAIKEPPLATFAMFAEASAPAAAAPRDPHDGPLRRPESRDTMPARPTPTGKEPVLLRVAAEAAGGAAAPSSPKRRKGAARKKGAALQLFMEEC